MEISLTLNKNEMKASMTKDLMVSDYLTKSMQITGRKDSEMRLQLIMKLFIQETIFNATLM